MLNGAMIIVSGVSEDSKIYFGNMLILGKSYSVCMDREWILKNKDKFNASSIIIQDDTVVAMHGVKVCSIKEWVIQHGDTLKLMGVLDQKTTGIASELYKLKTKIQLIGAEFEFDVFENTNGELVLVELCTNGLVEFDLSKHKIQHILSTLAFYKSDVKHIIMDTDYTRIDPYAFNGANELKKIEIKGQRISLPEVMCVNCGELEEVITEKGAIIEVCKEAFYRCNLLRSIDLSGVMSVGTGAFDSTHIQLDGEYNNIIDIGGEAFRCVNGIGGLKLKNIELISKYAFMKSSIKYIEIGEVCSYIGAEAFLGCKELENVIINSKYLTKIESKTFGECIKLRELVLPKSVREIESDAFKSSGLQLLKVSKQCVIDDEDILRKKCTIVRY